MKSKKYLLKYEPWDSVGYHTKGEMYNLFLLKVSWFGLFKKQIKTTFLIPYESNFSAHFEHWDKLIKDKTPIK